MQPPVGDERVSDNCDFYQSVSLWPMDQELDYQAWLANFESSEKRLALQLLGSFTYLSATMTRHLFASAIHRLSGQIPVPNGSSRAATWASFCERALIVTVEGETPSVTDSSSLFARICRDLGFTEANISSPGPAITKLYAEPDRPVLFVDDFIGSGNQMITTWFRDRPTAFNGNITSFAELAAEVNLTAYYALPIASLSGKETVERQCVPLTVSAANVLNGTYSALHRRSAVWPEGSHADGIRFVRSASERAGIPSEDGQKDHWRGFANLGLCLAFEHSIPDATLPLFWWEQNGWAPLRRRS